ncbi:MAG: glycosyltransferase [Candidatus Omnitrophica bacterium]|nr:glycosyltransferase [Candidatus Omnitrophota bacterium]
MTQEKILRIATRLNIGGPAIHAALLTTRLNPSRFVTCLVVGEPDVTEGDLSGLVTPGSARLIRVRSLRRPIRPWADFLTWWRLCGILWKERPSIIHTHMAKAGALGRLAGWWYNVFGQGRLAGRRAILIHTFHGHVLEGYFSGWLSRIFLWVERWLARRTDCLIAVSPTIRDDLLAKGIGRAEQWRVIPLGLDLTTLSALPVPNGSKPIRFGMVGRLVPVKNPRLFLQALSRLLQAEAGEAASGVIVGDGPLREALERETSQMRLSHAMTFTGWQQDLCSVYRQLDVACVTSWNEGTPVSLIEAMAASRAVIATDVGGVRDLLADPSEISEGPPRGSFQVVRRGVLVQAGDAEGFTAAMRRLAQDTALRQQVGAAGRTHVVRAHAAERLLQDVSALYEQLLGEARCRR